VGVLLTTILFFCQRLFRNYETSQGETRRANAVRSNNNTHVFISCQCLMDLILLRTYHLTGVAALLLESNLLTTID